MVREVVLEALRSGEYIQDFLARSGLEGRDLALAREIASGTIRRQLSLDYIIERASHRSPKEKELLRMSLYQLIFMDRIPDYAVIDEALKLAGPHTAPYVHAVLSNFNSHFPEGLSAQAMSIRLSYPLWFVKRLISVYGQHEAEEILKQQNIPPPIMRRPSGYIQNITPPTLLANACQNLNPTRILDLCASPGGKTLAAHSLFPNAELHANDLSPKKMERLEENFHTYNINAHLTVGPGQEYKAIEPFDLIIVDAPCSNSGVLAKRAEARWRLTKEKVKELAILQRALLKHAATLLSPRGAICYMTCSILPEENERHQILTLRHNETILPNADGYEGGFAALFSSS